MLLKSKIFLLSIIIVLCIISCNEKQNEEPGLPDLRVYINRFEQEAKIRGYDVSLAKLEAVYVDEAVYDGNIYCGLGYWNYKGTGKRLIKISKSCRWVEMNDTEKEIFMFHELGHAFLARPHDDTRLCDSSPLSLMISDEIFSTYSETKPDRRAYYLDELFDKLATNEECIKRTKDWKSDPLFYRGIKFDQHWQFISENKSVTGAKTPENLITFSAVQGDSEDEGYWYRDFMSPNIPECADVHVTVNFGASKVKGPGVKVEVGGYHAPLEREGASPVFKIANEAHSLTGDFENYAQESIFSCFSRRYFNLFVKITMLPGTVGEVTVNDVEILIKEN